MAKKSKTQRAKASAQRAVRKEEALKAAELAASKKDADEPKKRRFKLPFFTKKGEDEAGDSAKREKAEKHYEPEPKRSRFQFLKDVRAEMRRVTWPSRQDVGRWSVVVVGALLFFGVFVLILDNWIVTPILLLISSLGA